MRRFHFSATVVAFIAIALFSPHARAGEAAAGGPRIISLYAAHTEVLLRLGARDNIIGVSRQESYQGPETEGWTPPVFSIRDDVEKFLVARPDIVLARPQHLAGGARLREALENAGIKVIARQVVEASDLYDYWRFLASLVGREKEAEEMIARFDAEAARYRAASEKRRAKPGVFLEAIHREIKTFTPGSIPVWLVETAGGRNVADDAVAASPGVVIADCGPERLLARANEVEILISQEGAMNRASLEEITARNFYQPLPAVKNHRVHKIPEAFLARPTPSLLDGMRTIAAWTGLEAEMR